MATVESEVFERKKEKSKEREIDGQKVAFFDDQATSVKLSTGTNYSGAFLVSAKEKKFQNSRYARGDIRCTILEVHNR